MTDLEAAEFARRRKIARWVAHYVMPHEIRVRAWLERRVSADEASEVIQDSYIRLSMLEDLSHIDRADAYFFSIARNLLRRRISRKQIVAIDLIAEIDAYQDNQQPSPEQVAIDRSDRDRVYTLIARLPQRCRDVVRLRKIEGWSQKDIAVHLNITEKAVEKQVWLGMRAIRRAWGGDEPDEVLGSSYPVKAERS